jgi:hypothetical protein
MIDDVTEARIRHALHEALDDVRPHPEAFLRFQALLASRPTRRSALAPRPARANQRPLLLALALALAIGVIAGVAGTHLFPARTRVTTPAAPSPPVHVSTPTAAASPILDPAIRGYVDLIHRDATPITTHSNPYKAQCRLPDTPRLDVCRGIGLSVASDVQHFLDDLAAATVPPKLAAADAALRGVLRDLKTAADAVVTIADSGRPGPLPSDLVGLASSFQDATGAVQSAASAGG